MCKLTANCTPRLLVGSLLGASGSGACAAVLKHSLQAGFRLRRYKLYQQSRRCRAAQSSPETFLRAALIHGCKANLLSDLREEKGNVL